MSLSKPFDRLKANGAMELAVPTDTSIRAAVLGRRLGESPCPFVLSLSKHEPVKAAHLSTSRRTSIGREQLQPKHHPRHGL
ncbi:MAG: hypothetical protein ACM3W8_02170 [Sideroxydans sp.]